MSDTAATDAAVATPVEAAPEPVAVPQEAQVETQAPERVEGRAGVVQRAKEAYEARAAAVAAAEPVEGVEPPIKTSEAGTHHRKDGTFASKDEIAGTASSDAVHAEGSDSKRGEPPEGFVRIELPDGHPWRRGEKTYYDAPADIEQDVRTVINAETRRQTVDSLKGDLQKAERARVEMAVRLDLAQKGLLRSPDTDPELKGFLQDVQNKYPELYESVRTALEKAPNALLHEAVESAEARQAMVSKAEGFLDAVRSPQFRQHFSVWSDAEFQQNMAREVARYGDYVDSVGGDPKVEDLQHRLDVLYVRDPRVTAQVQTYRQTQAQKTRESIEAEVRAKLEAEFAEKQAALEVQGRHRLVRGVGTLASAGRNTGATSVSPETAADREARLSPDERRQAARARWTNVGKEAFNNR